MEILVGLLIFWCFCGGLGAWVAGQKNREAGEGFALGVLFGPFGVLIEALLPEKYSAPRHSYRGIPERDDDPGYDPLKAMGLESETEHIVDDFFQPKPSSRSLRAPGD